MDKLRAISVFRRVVELGSFKAAAEDLNISTASVSKNIHQLEDFLKSPLIQRTTRKMHITEKGQQYYHSVRNILDELKNADLAVIESATQLQGQLKISVPMSAGLLHFNSIVCDFMQLHPDISVELIMSDQYLDLIAQGIDVAIRGGGQFKSSSLKSRRLHGLHLTLCASPAYIARYNEPQEPEDLISHNCLIYSLSSSPRQWAFRKDEELKIIDISKSNYAVNNGLAVKQAALAGMGVALTPEIFISEELQNGELVRLLPHWQADRHALHAVYPHHKEQSKSVRAFIDFIVDYLVRDDCPKLPA